MAHRSSGCTGLGNFAKIALNGICGPFTAANAFDHRGRTGYRVSGGKDACLGRRHAGMVDIYATPWAPVDAGECFHTVIVHKLPNG